MSTTLSRPPTRRRALLTTAAWATPAALLAVSAPALAASRPCTTQSTLAWTSLANTATPRRVVSGAQTTVTPANLTVTYGITGATGATETSTLGSEGNVANALRLFSENVNTGTGAGETRQTITLTFSRPIKQWSLRILDVDQSNASADTVTNTAGVVYQDYVVVDPVPTSTIHGPNTTGNGTAANPYTSRPAVGETPATGTSGNLTATWAPTQTAGITQISIAYYHPQRTRTGFVPRIALSDVTFTPLLC